MNSFIGTKEVAARLKISVRRVQALIASGKLPAERIGNSFAVKEADLKLVTGRKNGRPMNGEEHAQDYYDKILEKYIACLKDLPPDLSTNPNYMKGFGRDK